MRLLELLTTKVRVSKKDLLFLALGAIVIGVSTSIIITLYDLVNDLVSLSNSVIIESMGVEYIAVTALKLSSIACLSVIMLLLIGPISISLNYIKPTIINLIKKTKEEEKQKKRGS